MLPHIAACDQQFRIALSRILPEMRRHQVQAVKVDPRAGAQPYPRLDRRHIVPQQEFHFRIDEFQFEEQVHAIRVVLRLPDDEGIIFFQDGKLTIPPGIRLDGKEQVGIRARQRVQHSLTLPIALQHVRHQQADAGVFSATGRGQRHNRHQRRKGNYSINLITERQQQRHHEQAYARRTLCR